MQVLKKQLTQALALLLFSSLFSIITPAMAESDQQMYLKAREMQQQKTDSSDHAKHVDKSKEFRGVFYGFLPCNDCPGVKMTLSLKQNNNYLLVIQYARESSRELYEKGKYLWNDDNKTVLLTPRKGGTATRHYHIENAELLIQLNEDGTRMVDHGERYALRRSDTVKSHDVHLH